MGGSDIRHACFTEDIDDIVVTQNAIFATRQKMLCFVGEKKKKILCSTLLSVQIKPSERVQKEELFEESADIAPLHL